MWVFRAREDENLELRKAGTSLWRVCALCGQRRFDEPHAFFCVGPGDEVAAVKSEIDFFRLRNHVVVSAMDAMRLVLLMFFAGIFNH
jgi:hypothetical protein